MIDAPPNIGKNSKDPLNGEEPAAARILIVDDEPIALDLSETALIRHGFQTITARGGEEGLAKIEETLPDLILLDVTMPDLDGFQVFERIRNNPETELIPVIFLTARDDLGNKMKGLELGAVDYIAKPYDVNELVARVRSNLRLRSLERKVLEREKNDLRKEIVGQLLTTVAHYINNATAAIEGFAYVTPSDNPEKVDRMKKVIQRQTRVISATIHGIEVLLKELEMKTSNYSSLNLTMLDIEDSIKERLQMLKDHDQQMGRE